MSKSRLNLCILINIVVTLQSEQLELSKSLLSGLATCTPDYLLQEWDRTIYQAELTLNLLRNSRLNPKLLAWEYLFGNFDFNKSPLLPLGTQKYYMPNQEKEQVGVSMENRDNILDPPLTTIDVLLVTSEKCIENGSQILQK